MSDVGALGRALGAALCLAWALAAWPAEARAGDPALGAYLATECAACHQLDGKTSGAIPAIVGWPVDQFVATLEAFRSKQRDDEVMQNVASRLSDEDIAALAAYFGSLKPRD